MLNGTDVEYVDVRQRIERQTNFPQNTVVSVLASESESEVFTGDTSKDNHSPGPVVREVSP